jgi:predicted glycosyltransferase
MTATQGPILFVSYGGGHVNMIVPVVKQLLADGMDDPIVLGLTTAGAALDRAGISYVGYRDLIGPDDTTALEHGERLLREMGASATVAREESIAYLGLSYFDLVVRFGEEQARRLYAEQNRHAFLPLTVMERFFEQVRPSVVVATNAPKTEKAAILIARKLGIPAVCVVDLFDPREFADRLSNNAYADRICMSSDFAKQKLVEAGRDPSHIVVTGNPAFDVLADREQIEAEGQAFLTDLGWMGKKVILWAKQVQPLDYDLYERIELLLFDLLKKHADWRLVFRPHPSDPGEYLRLPEGVHLSRQDERLPAVLSVADVIITMNSTVALEAALLATPVITADMSKVAKFVPYSEMGVSLGLKDLADLEQQIQQCLNGEFQPIALPKAGQAAAKVKQVILELQRKKKATHA